MKKIVSLLLASTMLFSSVSFAGINPTSIEESSSKDNIYKLIDKKVSKGEMAGVIGAFAWASIDGQTYSTSLQEIKRKHRSGSFSETFSSIIGEEVMADRFDMMVAEATTRANEAQEAFMTAAVDGATSEELKRLQDDVIMWRNMAKASDMAHMKAMMQLMAIKNTAEEYATMQAAYDAGVNSVDITTDNEQARLAGVNSVTQANLGTYTTNGSYTVTMTNGNTFTVSVNVISGTDTTPFNQSDIDNAVEVALTYSGTAYASSTAIYEHGFETAKTTWLGKLRLTTDQSYTDINGNTVSLPVGTVLTEAQISNHIQAYTQAQYAAGVASVNNATLTVSNNGAYTMVLENGVSITSTLTNSYDAGHTAGVASVTLSGDASASSNGTYTVTASNGQTFDVVVNVPNSGNTPLRAAAHGTTYRASTDNELFIAVIGAAAYGGNLARQAVKDFTGVSITDNNVVSFDDGYGEKTAWDDGVIANIETINSLSAADESIIGKFVIYNDILGFMMAENNHASYLSVTKTLNTYDNANSNIANNSIIEFGDNIYVKNNGTWEEFSSSAFAADKTTITDHISDTTVKKVLDEVHKGMGAWKSDAIVDESSVDLTAGIHNYNATVGTGLFGTIHPTTISTNTIFTGLHGSDYGVSFNSNNVYRKNSGYLNFTNLGTREEYFANPANTLNILNAQTVAGSILEIGDNLYVKDGTTWSAFSASAFTADKTIITDHISDSAVLAVLDELHGNIGAWKNGTTVATIKTSGSPATGEIVAFTENGNRIVRYRTSSGLVELDLDSPSATGDITDALATLTTNDKLAIIHGTTYIKSSDSWMSMMDAFTASSDALKDLTNDETLKDIFEELHGELASVRLDAISVDTSASGFNKTADIQEFGANSYTERRAYEGYFRWTGSDQAQFTNGQIYYTNAGTVAKTPKTAEQYFADNVAKVLAANNTGNDRIAYIGNDTFVKRGNDWTQAGQDISTGDNIDIVGNWSNGFQVSFNGTNKSFTGYSADTGGWLTEAQLAVVENALEDSYDRGFDDGYDQGYADGFRDGVNSVTQ